MLWAALHCHQLELDVALRAGNAPALLAICNALQVQQASEAAKALGVRPGVRKASALSMAPQLHVIHHQPGVQQEALEQVATWLLQFSPSVSLQPPEGVLVDLQASLRLFGGRARLVERICSGLSELGFSIRLALAPTPTAAWLLAQYQDGSCIEHESLLAAGLAHLPVGILASAAAHRDALAAIGVHHFADLARMPRAGLAQRYGTPLLTEIDRALGRQAEPRHWFQAPARFSVRLELLAQVEQAEALLFASQRLLRQLCAWLGARRAACRQAVLIAEHDRAHRGYPATPHTRIELRLSQPSRDPERFSILLREQLARLTLPAPVHTLQLNCDEPLTLPDQHHELFPTPGSDTESLSRLVERLQSRLGQDQVQRLVLVADHRPEAAYRIDPLDQPGQPRRSCDTEAFLSTGGMPRPLWLLNEPLALPERQHRPWWHGPLTLLAGPERIETGWWDARLIQRDYFIAQAESSSWLWIYRTRPAHEHDSGWFLQGLFG